MSDEFLFSRGFPNMFGGIAHAARNGLQVESVIDVGAYEGEWTRAAHRIFPRARFLMAEANPAKAPILERVAKEIPAARHVSVLLGARPDTDVPYYLLETGSSVLEEVTTYPKQVVKLPMDTLDCVIARSGLAARYLLKLDVQGYELEVLKGAQETLRSTEAIVAELSLIEYNRNQPLLDEVVGYLSSCGFVPYDFLSILRRSSDQALFQTDILFVRRDHELRRHRKFHEDEPE